MRGHLILIEGLDRSGKSTQVANLNSRIPGSKILKFPDRNTNIGKIINEYLTNEKFTLPDQSIHLLFSANRWELYQQILDDLNLGTTVILDRYIYSGIAYSLSKLKWNNVSGQMADVDWLYGPDKGLPKPDLTIFLTLSLEEITARALFGNERYENLEFQGIVKQNFLQLLDSLDETIKILDVNGKDIQQVSEDVWRVIEGVGAEKQTGNDVRFFN